MAIGENPLHVEAIAGKLRRAASGAGPGGIFTLALAAIDLALWDLYGKGELRPDTVLTGMFVSDETIVNPQDVMLVIDDAREEEIQRQLRRAATEAA